MPTIAPWLDVNPRDFTAAAEGGARIGLEERGQNIDAAQRAAALAQQASESATAHQLEQERIQGALAEAKQRTEIQTQLAARKFQAQQTYQNAVNSGMDPVQAMMQFGPQMGMSMSGVGSLALENFKNRQTAMMPQPVMDPNDPSQVRGYSYGGTFHPVPLPKTQQPKIGIGAKARLAAAQKAVENAVTPEQMKTAQATLDKISEEIDNPETEQVEDKPEAALPESGFIGSTPGIGLNKFDPTATGFGAPYVAPTTATAAPSAPTNQNDPLGLFTK